VRYVAEALGAKVSWDEAAQQVRIDTDLGEMVPSPIFAVSSDSSDLAKTSWHCTVHNTDEESGTVNNGWMLELTHIGMFFYKSNESGESACLSDFDVSDKTVAAIFYMDSSIGETLAKELTSVANENDYTAETIPDTPAQREKQRQYFRVYVNGQLAGGQFVITGGNGHSDYEFKFDNRLNLQDVQTIRLEMRLAG
jgi:hypothetical protein